ncbi:Proteasome subunit beta type [Spironucleus salmonicida]|uniref:proteasome endopeptidase complex n=1 Tax=Spironucleus salmonicida TaxID=348837 RepID=V6LSN6_9EUKA|nr:Proteasome subunit beta type [Spironucleus salmonicida]|eukprot:EST43799.1 Proteasome subunit beta type [Spironucleus salmonicida]
MNTNQFDFSLAPRYHKAPPSLTFTSTGTTIVGCVFDQGVVLAADTRATAGTVVADRNCNKLEAISQFIYCAGAGTAADTFAVKKMARDQLKLNQLKTEQEPLVSVAGHIMQNHLFNYQGHVSAALILGGIDEMGAHLISLQPHGSADYLPYSTLGSGSLAARAVFNDQWTENVTESQAKDMCEKAIRAGIMNDLGSGSNVDLVVIKRGGVEHIRGYKDVGNQSAGLVGVQ